MIKENSSYKQIMKTTSFFGGVQVFSILIKIIRSKFIAILLGPEGMGIAGLLDATISTISGFTGFGLGISAVKDVAASNTSGDENRVSKVVSVVRKCVWATGILGLILTIGFSYHLSLLTFGNTKYTLAFIFLSITLLLTQITSGELVILQGLRKFNYLAKANLAGAVLGLIFSVPIYFFFKLDGIVPAMIFSSIITTLVTLYYSNKVQVKKEALTTRETIKEAKSMLVFGFLISLNGIFVLGISYLIRLFIAKIGGIDQVGLYNAGFAIINTYVGMIFIAMATDYLPRLAGVAHDTSLANKEINNQSEMAILILAPFLNIFLVFINWIVILLYSSMFTGINSMIQWCAIGMLFKTASWAIAYIFVAKSDNKSFIINESVANLYIFFFNLTGYYFWGLEGLGVSFLAGYAVYFLQVTFVSRRLYRFIVTNSFIKPFIVQLLITVSCLIIVRVVTKPFSYLLGSVFIFFSLFYSYIELQKRFDIGLVIKNIITKKKFK